MLSQVIINVVCLRFAAVAETCDHDLTSALQTHSQAVRHSVADAGVSQVDRVFEAIRNTASDAEVICVSAQAGEEAPFPGTFTPASGHKVEVGVGHTASESGEYCVQNSLVSLMQRATIDGQAVNFEAVVGGKGADKSTSGKNSRRRRSSTCQSASDRCKRHMKRKWLNDICGKNASEDYKKQSLQFSGCKDVAEVDAVCKSDCNITCAQVLKGQQAVLIKTKEMAEEALLKDPDMPRDGKFHTWSDVACCNVNLDGFCVLQRDEISWERDAKSGNITQGEAWKMLAEEKNNDYNDMTDKCTAQMFEDSCK